MVNKTVMKILIILCFFIILFLFQNKTYAADAILLCTYETNAVSGTTEAVIERLNEWYGYKMTKIYNPLYLGTENNPITITATKSGDKYLVKIGSESSETTSNRKTFSIDELKTNLDCPYDDEDTLEENDYTWTTILKIQVSYEKTGWTKTGIKITFNIEKADKNDSELINRDYTKSDVINIESVAAVWHSFLKTIEGAVDTIYDLVDGIADAYNWVKKFTSNAVGTIANLILDGVMNIFGDGPQLMINYVQMAVDGTTRDKTMLYSIDYLKEDQNEATMYAPDKRDQYTNIETYDDESESIEADNNADVVIEDTDDNAQYEEDEDTEGKGYMFEDNLIPITSVDLYTMAANKVSFLDVNFLTTNTAGADSNIWLNLRKFVASVIRASIYIAAIILIMALIWYGVKIVMNSMDPRGRAEDKEGLNRFITGVTMLVGTIIIMAISIYAYQAVGIVENTDTSDPEYWEFPIRVNVRITEKEWYSSTIKGQFYSFSTTITGYIRFMAQIENPDRCMEKAGYVIAYIVLANMNVIIFVIMLFRMFAMWILAMVGPILAALYAITRSDRMMSRYKTWAFCYLILGFIQLFFAIAYWIMMEAMGFN